MTLALVAGGSMSLILAVDVDGTLADLVGAVVRELSRRLGRRYQREQWRSYWLEETFAHDPAALELAQQLLQQPEFVAALLPLPWSAPTLRQLSLVGPARLLYLTARPSWGYELTGEWLRHHRFPHGPLVLVDRPEGKLTVLGELQASEPEATIVVIDDSPMVARLVAGPAGSSRVATRSDEVLLLRAGVILIDQPYNQECSYLLLRRARSWRQVPRLVQELVGVIEAMPAS